ncbi:MAG: hypothetical protein K9L99_05825 [Candidatus Omnitrophica bacterium]|nr:hypothetical protein [Candidatus Omnitrophota bacterium]
MATKQEIARQKIIELCGSDDPDIIASTIRELKEEEVYRLENEKYCFFEPNGKGEEFIKAVGDKNENGEYNFIVLFSAANGVGKCKSLKSTILMADGKWKELGDIKKGDIVLGHNYTGDGKAIPCKVIGTSRAGIKKLYKFTFKDGGYTIASDEHSYPVKIRSGRKSKIIKKTIKELREYKQNYIGGSIKFQSPKVIEFRSDSELPIHPYILGLLLGDGTLGRGSVKFTTTNKDILKRLKRLLGDHYIIKNNGIDYRITANYKNYLLQDLRLLELAGAKSDNKFIPNIYKTASIEDRKQLLAGLIDTDGSLKEYSTKSKQLAEDFCFLVKSLGGRAISKTKTVNNNFTHNKDSLFYRVYWRFDYKLPLTCDYKQNISKKPIEYSNRFVDKIEYIGEEETGDIWIEHKDHCYISDDFISTGNTATAANIVAHILFGKDSYNKYFDLPLFKNFPYPKVGRIVSDPENLKTNLIPTLKEWFPFGRYKAQKSGKQYDSHWTTDTGHSFDIMSYEQDPKEFESVTLGWCIEENERILLSDGRWVKIKDVKIGDEVLNTTDNFRKEKHKVVGVYDKGEKDIIKIKVRGGTELKCTPDHKIWVSNKGWVEAGKLNIGDRLYSPVFNIKGKDTISKENAFMLGSWIGDGWFDRCIFIATANKEFLKEITEKVDKITHKDRYSYRIVDKTLRNLIINSDLSDKKAYNKFVPNFIFKEDQNKIEFLKGLYATDGWFTGHSIGYGSTSKRLAEDIKLLLNNIGIRSGIYFKKSQRIGKWRDQWFVLITQKDNVIKFCDLIKINSKKEYQDKVLKEALRRKGDTIGKERSKRDTRRSIISIEKYGRANVYDISVEGEHSFICNGLRVSNCWFDEPPTEAIFKATVSRMRKGGIIFISETPLYAAWLYDHIVANPDKDLAKKGQRVYIEAGVESACKQHGIRGHLEHSDIERMTAEYSEDEKQARIYGKFQHLVGLRFKQFSRNIHIVKPFEIDPAKYSVYHALDTHPRVNDAGIWIAVDEQGRKFVIEEFWEKCQGGTEEMAQRLKNINSNYRIAKKILEPAAFVEDQHTEASLAKRLSDYGLNYLPATKTRTLSDTRIEDALAFQKIVIGEKEEYIKFPELYIFDTCQRTIFEMEHYRWDDWTGKTSQNRGLKEKTVDKDDHMIEDIGRILIQEPVFVPPEKNNGNIITTPEYDPYY